MKDFSGKRPPSSKDEKLAAAERRAADAQRARDERASEKAVRDRDKQYKKFKEKS